MFSKSRLVLKEFTDRYLMLIVLNIFFRLYNFSVVHGNSKPLGISRKDLLS